MQVIISMSKDSILLFTDPACMGHTNDHFSETGDVDDIACSLHLAQVFGRRLIHVICDSERFEPYMQSVGNKLRDIYGCTFIMEEELEKIQLTTLTTVYIHSPTRASSAQWIEKNINHIAAFYRQGDDQSVNFKHSPEMRTVLARTNVTLYRTQDTEFTIEYDPEVNKQLGGLAKQIYHDYFEFSYRKKFGTAMHLPYCDRLYSDTGKNGGPGNGILMYLPLLERLPPIVLPDVLEQALLNTIQSTDPSSLVNLRNIVGVLHLYCDYASLIVDGKLPNMGNLKSLDNVTKWETCPEFIKEFFRCTTSTPLYDFASGYWSTRGHCTREQLQCAVVDSLKQLEMDTTC
jgi:hypothetical protein